MIRKITLGLLVTVIALLVAPSDNAAALGGNFTETWTGTNGDPWPAGWTTITGGSGQANPVIKGNEGHVGMTHTVGLQRWGAYYDQFIFESLQCNFDLFNAEGSNERFKFLTRWDGLVGSSATGYAFEYESGSTVSFLRIQKYVAGTLTNLSSQFSIPTIKSANVHLWLESLSDGLGGTDLRFHYDSATEPVSWDLEVIGDTEAALQGINGYLGYGNWLIGLDSSHQYDDLYCEEYDASLTPQQIFIMDS